MLESFMVKKDSLKNVVKDGFVIGFKFDVRIAEYRGCFLSLHNGYYINIDGTEYPRGLQRFEINGKAPRDFDEIAKCVWEHWDYDDPGTVYVQAPGGLAPGRHRVGVMQSLFTQYGWHPHDEEMIKNPPAPGASVGGKQDAVYYYDMIVE
ncbi:MAG: DUF6379 domain-containing protein [Clostridiales bacterium]|jgi:hypothetical protein|nr:DUF6379 domain-containing protein [Clostridiales bacterium]